MSDMLVNLYRISEDEKLLLNLREKGIHIYRALSPDKTQVLDYVKANWDNWSSETDVSFSRQPISCYIAVKDKKVIGFACYNVTGKGYFGPTAVSPDERKQGIGKALLLKCLLAMKEEEYGYAVIGWAAKTAIAFYQESVSAVLIPDSEPGIYERLINISHK